MTTDDDELTSRAQGRIGTVLRGKYRIDRVLGVGGMAVVYKATHRNQAEFAVKMLHPELSLQEDIRTRFLREGYAANSVKHPGAVAVVDDDVAEDGAAFLVMELLRGAPVESLWERSGCKLPVRAVLAVADQLLDVLVAAHAKGVVHRDIKPANLFVTHDGTLKVLDFGIARVKAATGVAGAGHRTGTGMLLGTPAFMAPEQAYAKAREIDGQTDIWAVGATLFTLLCGQPVHEGENSSELMIHAATVRARPLASLAADVPPAIAQVIDRALSFEKASRWPTAAAMREAVRQASVAALGVWPSKQPLAALLEGEALGHASTVPPPASRAGAVAVGLVVAAATAAPAGLGPRAAATAPVRRRPPVHLSLVAWEQALGRLTRLCPRKPAREGMRGMPVSSFCTTRPRQPRARFDTRAHAPLVTTVSALKRPGERAAPGGSMQVRARGGACAHTVRCTPRALQGHAPQPGRVGCVVDSAGHHQYKPECL
jgi:serine/threonine-protein kinase